MKINKKLLEAVSLKEAEEETAATPDVQGDGVIDSVKDSTPAEIKDEVIAAGEKVDEPVSNTEAKTIAADIIKASEILGQKGADYAAVNAKDRDSIIHKLNACLRGGIKRWKTIATTGLGQNSKSANLLIYGAPGFGKTAGVDAWCDALGIYLLQIPISTLNKDIIAGIPWPQYDEKKKKYVQTSVEHEMWTPLFDQTRPVVVFLDEVNTSKPDIEQALLTFIADRMLPIATRDKDGNVVKNLTQFNNILFFVGAMNPQNKIFTGTHPLNFATDDRLLLRHKQEGSKQEFLAVLDLIYGAVLKNPYLSTEDHLMYENQYRIGQTLMKDKNMRFNTIADLVRFDQESRGPGKEGELPKHGLNYRNLSSILFTCDGTKDDFLNLVRWADFSDETVQKMEIALANYVDKKAVGNSIWNQAQVAPEVQIKAAAEVDKILQDLSDSF